MTAYDLPTERQSPLARLSGAISCVTVAMSGLGAFWVFASMLLVCADIFGRNVLNAPIRGVAELLSYSILAIVYLQMPHALKLGRFTQAEVLTAWLDRKRPLVGSVLAAIFCLFGVAVFAVLASKSYMPFVTALLEGEIDGMPTSIILKVWPFKFIVFLGAVVTATVFALQAIEHGVAIRRHFAESRLGGGDKPSGWPALVIFAGIALAAWLFAETGPSNVTIGLVSVLFMLALVSFGLHIGTGLIIIGFFGIWLIRDNPAIAQRTFLQAGNEFLRNHVLAVIPLFVMMGLLVGASDVGKETFEVARSALRRIKGGLGVATVVANAIFAAITGSSIASAAVFTKIASPEMIRHGYTKRFAIGVVAGTSVLGMLIPPSLLLIVYAFLAEQSVGILFLAAVVPGLILAVAMSAGIILMAYKMPWFVGGTEAVGEEASETLVSSIVKIFPIITLIVIVLGGIYGGVLTPAEGGAAGAAGALVIALVRRKITPRILWDVLIETGNITASILFLILSANVYSRMISMSGLPQYMSEFISAAGLSFYSFMAAYIILLIFLGMVLDSVSIMLIILPLALPVIHGMGGDLVWFGIVSVIAVEIGLLTPPVGLTCYVVKSTINDPSITLGDIFSGAFPFVIIMIFVTILLVAVPELCLLIF